jgi:excisionase family DNA binding protein
MVTETRQVPRIFYTFEGAAEQTGMSVSFLYKEKLAGKLKVTKVGRSSRIHEADLREWAKLYRSGEAQE